jgi:hypothetical protein
MWYRLRTSTWLLVLALPLGCSDGKQDPDGGPDGPAGDLGADSRTDGPPPVEECKNPPLTPPPSGTCTVIAGSGTAQLYRGTVLAPGKALRNGHLLVEAGRILCAACDCSQQPAFSAATRVECARGVISAALINPHDHIGWTTARPFQPTVRYSHRHEWRRGKNGMPVINTPGSTYKTEPVLWGEVRMLLGGTVSMLGEGGVKGLVRNLEQDNEGLGKPKVNNSTFPLGDSSGVMLAQGCGYPKIPTLAEITGAVAWVPHVSEGVIQEARNEFLCLSGQQAGGVDATQLNAAFIHSVGLDTLDVLDMARSGTGAVWSPRSNISLYGFTANVVQMDHLGVRISIGTDWVISGSMNMLRELACADLLNRKYYGGHFTDQELFEMATVNAAAAAGVDDVIGQLKEGTFADLAIWNGDQRQDYAAVLRAGVADVVLVTRAGVAMYGDEALVTALAPTNGEGCEPLEVCQVKKRLCLQRETGKDLAALKAVVGDAYPLFFCGDPEGEPTCVPSRPGEYSGVITDSDGDGDGVPNDKDTCPRVFNPPRKMDGMKQPDRDGDKLGDECDPCPLDANTLTCSTSPKPNDKDGDGVTDDKDNCPLVPNKGQEDADKDGVGDACDACPQKSNPGGTACPYTIKELRDRSLGQRPPNGTTVRLQNVTVTAVRTSKPANFGFYVREGKAAFEAIFIFTNTAIPVDAGGTALKPGDRVNLQGKLAEFNNIDEVDSPTQITVNGSGDISPVPVKTADLRAVSATAEAQESQLVQVSAVTVTGLIDPATTDAFWVTDDGQTCAGATPPCTKVGDFFYDGSVVDGKPTVAAGGTFSSITGLVNGFKNDYSLEPRSPDDLVP